LPPLFGLIVNAVVAFVVVRSNASIVFFLIGDFLYGVCGSLHAMTMSCFAYVADRTPAERRMVRITLLQLCMMVPKIVSSIGIGPIMAAVGPSNVILIALVILVANFTYVFAFLRNDEEADRNVVDANSNEVDGRSEAGNVNAAGPGHGAVDSFDTAGNESPRLPRFRYVEPRSRDPQPRPETPEPRFERKTRTLCNSVMRVFSLFLSSGRHRIGLNLLMAAFFISTLPTFDFALMNLFEMNQPLCWTVREIGIFTGTTVTICAVGALVVTPLMKRCATDWHIAVTACVANIITSVYKFFVQNSLMMYLCKYHFVFFSCWQLLCGPHLRDWSRCLSSLVVLPVSASKLGTNRKKT